MESVLETDNILTNFPRDNLHKVYYLAYKITYSILNHTVH